MAAKTFFVGNLFKCKNNNLHCIIETVAKKKKLKELTKKQKQKNKTENKNNMGSVEDITLEKIKSAHQHMIEKASKLFHKTPLADGMEKRLIGEIPNVQSLSFKLESVQNTGIYINSLLYFKEFFNDI